MHKTTDDAGCRNLWLFKAHDVKYCCVKYVMNRIYCRSFRQYNKHLTLIPLITARFSVISVYKTVARQITVCILCVKWLHAHNSACFTMLNKYKKFLEPVLTDLLQHLVD